LLLLSLYLLAALLACRLAERKGTSSDAGDRRVSLWSLASEDKSVLMPWWTRAGQEDEFEFESCGPRESEALGGEERFDDGAGASR
jgi:hypothetical protein